jgi:hypothetical protein
MVFLNFFYFFALLDPNPDSENGSGSTDSIESESNPDPDPQPWFSGHKLESARPRVFVRLSTLIFPVLQNAIRGKKPEKSIIFVKIRQ